MSDDLVELAAEAFVYGFPLVFDLEQVERFTERGMGSVPPTPFNQFAHAPELAGPEDTFVSINNDTVYSIAQLDVSGGPVRLDVPDTAGRYYVLQFVDAWTNNFAYVGHRATGTEGRRRSCWSPPAGTATRRRRHGDPAARPRSRRSSVAGRSTARTTCRRSTRCRPALTLTPTAAARRRAARRRRRACAEDLAFFEQLRVWMQAFPPAERDLDYQQRFAPLGCSSATRPTRTPTRSWRRRCATGSRPGKRAAWSRRSRTAPSPRQNGWKLGLSRVRLQPRLLRGRRDRRHRRGSSRTRRGPLRRAGAGGPRRAVGQPRLRGRVRDDLRGRRRRAARRRAPLRAALRRRRRRSARSGRSRCTTCRTSTSSPTRSTATRSATAPPASSTPTTGR